MKRPHMNPLAFIFWWLIYHPDRSPIKVWRESRDLKQRLEEMRLEDYYE